jgi:hypothetical protein
MTLPSPQGKGSHDDDSETSLDALDDIFADNHGDTLEPNDHDDNDDEKNKIESFLRAMNSSLSSTGGDDRQKNKRARSVRLSGVANGVDDDLNASSSSRSTMSYLPSTTNTTTKATSEDHHHHHHQAKVSFSTIQLKEYPVIAGDNPSVMVGVPLTIDWVCLNDVSCSVDEYEKFCFAKRSMVELRIPQSLRYDLLRRTGYSRQEIMVHTKNATVDRNRRRRTAAVLHLEPIHETIERIVRAVRNSTWNRSTKREERRWLDAVLTQFPSSRDAALPTRAGIMKNHSKKARSEGNRRSPTTLSPPSSPLPVTNKKSNESMQTVATDTTDGNSLHTTSCRMVEAPMSSHEEEKSRTNKAKTKKKKIPNSKKKKEREMKETQRKSSSKTSAALSSSSSSTKRNVLAKEYSLRMSPSTAAAGSSSTFGTTMIDESPSYDRQEKSKTTKATRVAASAKKEHTSVKVKKRKETMNKDLAPAVEGRKTHSTKTGTTTKKSKKAKSTRAGAQHTRSKKKEQSLSPTSKRLRLNGDMCKEYSLASLSI